MSPINFRRVHLFGFLVFLTGCLLALSALAQIAPDATGFGPLPYTSSEYRFTAVMDPDIVSGIITEVWARVYRPITLNDPPYPLLLFLHGNHCTCGRGSNPRIDDNQQYTGSGTCPPGYVVTPNHAGYGYLADRLASWGYVVVSINANRGITNCGSCPGPVSDPCLNLARGRLVLKHLQRLSEWNDTPGQTPLSLGLGSSGLLGKLDLGSVGLMGHSRGGEGMRAAYNLFREVGSPWPGRIHGIVTFQGIFEIGPVDGQVPSRVLNADGTNWTVLLPMCDGDVADLQGVKPFDRTIRLFSEDYVTPKANYTVWGANHNYYNTEWQVSESSGCSGPGNNPLFLMPVGSPQQQATGRASVNAFFRGTVFGTPLSAGGYDPAFMQNFNPQYGLPPVVTSVTRVDRGFTESADSFMTTRLEDFQGTTGTNSPYGVPNQAMNISIAHGGVPNHDSVQRAGQISWTSSGPDRFFQTNWAPAGLGRDTVAYATLDVRVSRQSSGLNPVGPTNFSLRLVRNDEVLSAPVQLSTYTDLRGPVGGPYGLHPILQTARIPLSAFGAFDLSRVRGVRFVFDGTSSGAIYLGDIRLSLLTGSDGAVASTPEPNDTWVGVPVVEPVEGAQKEITWSESRNAQGKKVVINRITRIQTVESSFALEGEPGIEIELVSSQRFPSRNEIAVLRIGSSDFLLSRASEDGNSFTLIFTLTLDEFAEVHSGDPVTLRYGRGEVFSDLRDFGTLDKALWNQ